MLYCNVVFSTANSSVLTRHLTTVQRKTNAIQHYYKGTVLQCDTDLASTSVSSVCATT